MGLQGCSSGIATDMPITIPAVILTRYTGGSHSDLDGDGDTQYMWGCNLGLNCNIVSYSDDIMIRSEELISRSDDVISRSDDIISHFGD